MNSALRLQPMPSLAEKLKHARLATGMSTRAVADRLSRRLGISHATIANYEKGRSVPPVTVLAALAEEYQRPLNWFLDRGPSLAGIRYRNLKSKVKVRDKHCYEGEAQRWLDAYLRIEQKLKAPLKPRLQRPLPTRGEAPHEFALRVRQLLDLKSSDSVPSLVEILEWFGVRVIEMETDLSIDAMAARYGDEEVVVLNPSVPNDRCRMNAAHELGHILLGDCRKENAPDHRGIEKGAFDFASHFILPNSRLKEAFDGQSMVRLVQYKERFGISLAAMVYRAEKARFITKDTAKRLWIEFTQRGWRANEPGYVRPDRATRFEQLLDGAIMKGTLTLSQAASLAHVREEEIRRRLRVAMGMDHYDGDDEPMTRILPLHNEA